MAVFEKSEPIEQISEAIAVIFSFGYFDKAFAGYLIIFFPGFRVYLVMVSGIVGLYFMFDEFEFLFAGALLPMC